MWLFRLSVYLHTERHHILERLCNWLRIGLRNFRAIASSASNALVHGQRCEGLTGRFWPKSAPNTAVQEHTSKINRLSCFALSNFARFCANPEHVVISLHGERRPKIANKLGLDFDQDHHVVLLHGNFVLFDFFLGQQKSTLG